MVERNNKQMTSIKIEVELETIDQIKKLFGSLEPGCSLQLCDGEVELKLMSTGNSLAFDGGLTAELILSFCLGVASGVIGNAIYTAICAGIKKLEINGRRTRITEESITQALETIKSMVSSSADKKRINKNSIKKNENKGEKKETL